MLIPLKHDNLTARRWPVVTIFLLAVIVLVFLATQGVMDQEPPELSQVKAHMLKLAKQHPELKLSGAEEKLVSSLRQEDTTALSQAETFAAPLVGSSVSLPTAPSEDAQTAQAEMDSLAKRYLRLQGESFQHRYAFVPAHPTAISYLTATFLHNDWLDLIGNLWFLWLAGIVLEDAWGRPLFAVFFLVAGAAALQMHAWVNPGSFVPVMGASGAVAALMGAFLVRFPKMKIHMAWLIGFKLRRFKAEVYWLLPLWLLMEVGYGTLFGNGSGISHWAHVGGFVFGAVAAVALKYSGLEKKASEQIDVKLNPEGIQEIAEAADCLQRGQLDQAVALVEGVLAGKPDSIDALNIQREVYWRRSQAAEYQEVSTKLCTVYLKRQAIEAALQVYDELVNAGGDNLPIAVWLTLARGVEDSLPDRALLEYEKLVEAYPTAPQSIMAQLGAARICLKKLNRPNDALKFLQAADASPVPHLDMEQSIQMAIKEATAALGGSLQPQLAKSMA
jgi:membrane associated rhomboid family serine protease